MDRGSRMRSLGAVTAITALTLGVGVAQAGGGTVSGSNFSFKPKTITIQKGGMVNWKWVNGRHTVTFVKGSFDKVAKQKPPQPQPHLQNSGHVQVLLSLPP
jgi:plastocyanin